MLLLGFPLDFREDEYVVNTIYSFGRVISWVDDGRHLSRIPVRAVLLIMNLSRSFLCSLKGKGSKVNPGLCSVRCCRDFSR